MKKHTESQTVSAILSYLHLRGIPAWRINTRVLKLPRGTGFGLYRTAPKGMADIIGIDSRLCCGRFFAIEVKAGKNRLTNEQVAFKQTVEQAGGLAFVARSVEDVREGLGL